MQNELDVASPYPTGSCPNNYKFVIFTPHSKDIQQAPWTVDSSTLRMKATRLETAKINVSGKSVTWTFDTLGTAAFPVAKVIPGVDVDTVYVAENPAYQGS